MARVPYATERELSDRERRLLAPYEELGEDFVPHVRSTTDDTTDREWQPPRLYRTLVHNPPLLESFRRTSSDLRAECGLDARSRELVILTTARATDATYEWHKHVRMARAGDVTDGEILSIAAGEYDRFDDRETALLEYVEAVASREVSDDHHAALGDHFETETIVGIVMLAQFYLGLAHVIDALGIELAEEFVGWTLDGDEHSSE